MEGAIVTPSKGHKILQFRLFLGSNCSMEEADDGIVARTRSKIHRH